MRNQFNSIRFVLPALITCAIVAGAQAQTNSPQKSRFRFVPTPRKQVATETATRMPVVAVIPAQDQSTAPSRLVPMTDRTAFQATRMPAQPSDILNQPPLSVEFAPPTVHGPAYAVVSVAQSQPLPTQEVYYPPAPELAPEQSCFSPEQTICEDGFVMNRNFFGIDKDEVCDEWAGFIGCCGLKANPGHYGQPFIVGCDPCEPNCGRCSKCLIEKHRRKHGKCGICSGCLARKKTGVGECTGEDDNSGGCKDCKQGAGANAAASERRWRDAERYQYNSIDPRTGRLLGNPLAR